MSQRRQLGTILLETGHITPQDVQRVLEYQRTHGGFFGEAVVALGIVSGEEMDWALASHFDLPFIFPDASAVDMEAAQLVPGDWALAHLAVPIVRAGKTLTVVFAQPPTEQVLEELRQRTALQIEPALASAPRIRELIHTIYAAQPARSSDVRAAVSFEELLEEALEHGAVRFGIALRGSAALGWWRSRTASFRAPLDDEWEGALDRLVEPPTTPRLGHEAPDRASWQAALQRGSDELRLDVLALHGKGGADVLFVPRPPVTPRRPVGGLPASLLTELRLLWSGGAARVGVYAGEIDVARALLPQLPALTLGDDVLAAHINVSGASDAPYTLRAENSDEFADSVADYDYDALTLDLPLEGYPLAALLKAAPLSFLLLDSPARALPAALGVNWLLSIGGAPGSPMWDLRALHR